MRPGCMAREGAVFAGAGWRRPGWGRVCTSPCRHCSPLYKCCAVICRACGSGKRLDTDSWYRGFGASGLYSCEAKYLYSWWQQAASVTVSTER